MLTMCAVYWQVLIVSSGGRGVVDVLHTQLGTYDPLLKKDGSKELLINKERASYWLAVGAQPTTRVRFVGCFCKT